MQQSVTFLGHVVTPDRVLPCPDNVAKILQWQQPTTVTEVRQFLGIASYYRKFIQAKSRKYQGVFEVKSRVKKWQVRGIWSEQLEH